MGYKEIITGVKKFIRVNITPITWWVVILWTLIFWSWVFNLVGLI